MKTGFIIFWATILLVLNPKIAVADGQLRLQVSGSNLLFQIEGDEDEDWQFQTSTNLQQWFPAPALGTLLAGGDDAPVRLLNKPASPQTFYRVVKTAGLFDPTLLRTMSLTFTQANWQSLLAAGRLTDSNTFCTLTLDNGATNYGAGARYRGFTSYTASGTKKSINLDIDYIFGDADLMGYDTVNLNNAFGDETLMREALYFEVMRNYTPCPKASLVQLYINGVNWGVYSFVQQQDNDFIREWFPSDNGHRWRSPSLPPGGFNSGQSAFLYLGNTNIATYQPHYELRSNESANAWALLVHAIDVLNNTPAATFRDKVEEVFAVDSWLWFLAIENVFADPDSYLEKGGDFLFYYEPESGRIHPVEHDGNEALASSDVFLSPVAGETLVGRPMICKLLSVPELRQRYLAHMRTVLHEFYNPDLLVPLMGRYYRMSVNAIAADPVRGFSMSAYTNDVALLASFVTNRFRFLTNHAEVRPLSPIIESVNEPNPLPNAEQIPFITARVIGNGGNGIDSVWLYYRGKSFGRFARVQMFDDGLHGDGAADDSVFGAATTNYPAGTQVRFYVEARSANAAKAASFAPARAEHETFSYRVALTSITNTPVVIHEFMADNESTLADPQGDFDDWIELRNVTADDINLSGFYLSDNPSNPRKWRFPEGTIIPGNGFLLVWADENGNDTPGLHASFKLGAGGEQILLADTDANQNAILDSITFPAQQPNISYGRSAADFDTWVFMQPTPGAANQ